MESRIVGTDFLLISFTSFIRLSTSLQLFPSQLQAFQLFATCYIPYQKGSNGCMHIFPEHLSGPPDKKLGIFLPLFDGFILPLTIVWGFNWQSRAGVSQANLYPLLPTSTNPFVSWSCKA